MNRPFRFLRATLALAALLATPLLMAGCFNPFAPTIASSGVDVVPLDPPPKASTPQGALQLLRWCWTNMRIKEYQTLFTDDFEFVFADVDAADDPPLHRDDEILVARHLFQDGTASEPRARRIDLTYGSALVPIPDQRPGKVDPYHKEITTRVVLKADLGESIWYVDGDVTFFLVRGDSAVLSQELIDLGAVADTKHWYIERWEDKTATGGSGGAAMRPAGGPRAGALSGRPTVPAARLGGHVEIHASWGDFKKNYLAP